MMFAIALPILLMIGLGTIDIHQASRVKANLQDALDAAALAAARSGYTDAGAIQEAGMVALRANMPDYFKAGSDDVGSFVLVANKLEADATVNVKVLVANIVLPPYGKLLDDLLPVSTKSEVMRASRNVEVAMALDITESMKGAPLTALKAAATELVGIVVQDQQTPFYSVMGIVPYSASVNLGPGLAVAARGPIRQKTNIQSGAYFNGAAKRISAISNANQGVITINGHDLQNGQRIRISGAAGYTSLNDKLYYVADRTANTFKLKTTSSTNTYVSTSSRNTYTGSGLVNVCIHETCGLILRSENHKLSSNENVYIEKMEGLRTYNGTSSVITVIDNDRFLLNGSSYSSTLPTANKGTVECLATGCARYKFNSRDGDSTLGISDCVTERTGSHAYLDTAPGATHYFGLMYPLAGSRSVCPESTTMALTSNRGDLEDKIDGFKVEGVTAGQIGLAWAWNLVSPNFNEFWGGRKVPGVRDDDKTLKVVVLMTDGEFNTNFCNGVVASDAPGRSLVDDNKAVMNNCPATNGNPLTQATSLCSAMKAQGIIIYTVGFNLSETSAINMLRDCATTTTNHYHNASSGTQLQDAFRAIGRDITRLRLAR